MNKNYYIEELTKKVESLDKRINILEKLLLDRPGSTMIRDMTDNERKRASERRIANGRG